MKIPTDIISIMEWFAFGCSLFLLHPKNQKSVRLLIIILALSVLVEIAGYNIRLIPNASNHQLYNVSVPVVILLYLTLFRNNIINAATKRMLLWMMGGYALFVALNLAFIGGISTFNRFNYIAGSVLLMMACTYYFLELIRANAQVSLKVTPMFWIAAAILLLYVPKTVVYSIFEYLAYKNETNKQFGLTFHKVNKFLSVIHFSILSYASICKLIFRR